MLKKEKIAKKHTKLSDSLLKSEITSIFNTGITGKMEVFGNIRKKYTCARDRFTKMYRLCLSEWGALKAKADSEATVLAATSAATIGLKSKLEKQLHIQEQITGIQSDIDGGILEEYVVVGGKLQLVKKIMNAETKAYLRKTMKELYTELNKMEGDYAPSKVAQTDKDGNDIKQFDLSKLSDDELRTLAELQRKGGAGQA